jgi:hypothetical protein
LQLSAAEDETTTAGDAAEEDAEDKQPDADADADAPGTEPLRRRSVRFAQILLSPEVDVATEAAETRADAAEMSNEPTGINLDELTAAKMAARVREMGLKRRHRMQVVCAFKNAG